MDVEKMILADKIITLRKKNGWSQEELAEKLKVSRQAVSKWEGAQTVPDLERILQMSQLFGVTTDYLLKDELDQEEYSAGEAEQPLRRVSMAEANAFLAWRVTAGWRIAIATFLCIIAAAPLILLAGVSENSLLPLTENQAAGIGMLILLLTVAAAVSLFIHTGLQNRPYAYLDEEDFEGEYGVLGMVRERQKEFSGAYTRGLIIGVALCVASPCWLFLAVMNGSDFMVLVAVCCLLLTVGVGILFLIPAAVRWASMEKLLKTGEYSEKEKSRSKVKEAVSTAYWLTVTALFLAVSFVTEAWGSTWIIWAVAGVVFAVVMTVTNLLLDRKEKQ